MGDGGGGADGSGGAHYGSWHVLDRGSMGPYTVLHWEMVVMTLMELGGGSVTLSMVQGLGRCMVSQMGWSWPRRSKRGG